MRDMSRDRASGVSVSAKRIRPRARPYYAWGAGIAHSASSPLRCGPPAEPQGEYAAPGA